MKIFFKTILHMIIYLSAIILPVVALVLVVAYTEKFFILMGVFLFILMIMTSVEDAMDS